MNKPIQQNRYNETANQLSPTILKDSFVRTYPNVRLSNQNVKGEPKNLSIKKQEDEDSQNMSHLFEPINFSEGSSRSKNLNREIRLSKPLSASYNKKLDQEKATTRVYSSVKPITTSSNIPPDHTIFNQAPKIQSQRYNSNGEKDAIQSNNYKLSLSGFQQKIHSSANTPLNTARIGKTEEELLGLKLEGANVFFQQKPIKTQRHFRRSIFLKNNTKIVKNVQIQKSSTLNQDEKQFKTLISKITQHPYNDEPQKIRKYDSTKLRVSNSAEKKRRKQAVMRQSVKVNVLNMIDGGNKKDFGMMRPNLNFKKIYSKCFSQEQYQHKMKSAKKLNNRDDLIGQLWQIQKSLITSSQTPSHNAAKESPANAMEKYTISCAEQIYNRRKSIQKNYTFKMKSDKAANKQQHRPQGQKNAEDFHVQGWNINQDFQRKQIMII